MPYDNQRARARIPGHVPPRARCPGDVSAQQFSNPRDFTVGRAKDISVTVPAGQWVQVFSSHGCYDSLTIGGATIETDGQVIDFTL
ncbi:hypothetical protein [Streptomyces sp. NPDC054940]